MRTSDFSYELPPELIAQTPAARRDESRLMRVDRNGGSVHHHVFHQLPSLLKEGDLLVLNDAKVIPARVFCRKPTGARIELFFVRPLSNGSWEAMAKPRRRLSADILLHAESKPDVSFRILDVPPDSTSVTVSLESGDGTIVDILEQIGAVPLPPYMQRPEQPEDRNRYQTVYANKPGAVAAPTAGLHFTPELLGNLEQKGIGHCFVTLHVGMGTFKPVTEENPTSHPMHEESFELPEETVRAISEAKRRGSRVIAVGTTVVRVLEHVVTEHGKLRPGQGSTRLLILPGYQFKVIDCLLTNFHLPRSTLLMLVSAFADREQILRAYNTAVKERYRFFSYGDAMLLC